MRKAAMTDRVARLTLLATQLPPEDRRLSVSVETQRPASTPEEVISPAIDTIENTLPDGWTILRCDYRGNVSSFGIYFVAEGPSGQRSDPKQYIDQAERYCWHEANTSKARASPSADEC
jgi:hypothetical protein